jgi:2-oxoglutarate ferredoxin oxidoreductase subunit alpha
MLGQMMEPVEFPEFRDLSTLPDHSDWALTGAKGREPHIVTSFDIDPYNLEKMNLELVEIYKEIEKNEVRWEEYRTEDADIVITAFGTVARIAKSVVDMAREDGIKVGLFRPITVWPYPYEPLEKLADKVEMFFDVEMNMGQMLEDVKLAVKGKKPIKFYSRMGGVVPTPNEIYDALKKEIGR